MSLITAASEVISDVIAADDPWGDPTARATVIWYLTLPSVSTIVDNKLIFNHDSIQLRTRTTGGDGLQARFVGDVGNATLNSGALAKNTPIFVACTHAPGAQAMYLNGSLSAIASTTVANNNIIDHSGIFQIGDPFGAITGAGAYLAWHGVCIIKGKALSAAELKAIYDGTAKPEDHASETVDVWFLPFGGSTDSFASGSDSLGWTNEAVSNGDYGLLNAGSGAGPDLTVAAGTPEWDENYPHRWDDNDDPDIGGAWSLPGDFSSRLQQHQQRVGLYVVGTDEAKIRRCIDAMRTTFGPRFSFLVVQLGGLGSKFPLGADNRTGSVAGSWTSSQLSKVALFRDAYYNYPVLAYQFDNEFNSDVPCTNASESGASFIRLEAPIRGAVVQCHWAQRQALRAALTSAGINPDKVGNNLYSLPSPVGNDISDDQVDAWVDLANRAKLDTTTLNTYYAKSINNQSDDTQPLTTNDGFDEQYEVPGSFEPNPSANSAKLSTDTTLEETRVGTPMTAFLTGGAAAQGVQRHFIFQWSPILFSSAGDDLIVSNYTGYASFKAWCSRTNEPIGVWADASSETTTAQFEFAMNRMGPSLLAGISEGGWPSTRSNQRSRGSRSGLSLRGRKTRL